MQIIGTEENQQRRAPKARMLVFVAGFVAIVVFACTWFYYPRFRDVPPPERNWRRMQAQAGVIALPPSAPADSSKPGTAAAANEQNASQQGASDFVARDTADPMKEFMGQLDDQVRKELLGEFGARFPELQRVFDAEAPRRDDPAYRPLVFGLLDAAKKAPADRRPAILFAADLVASHLWCEKSDAGVVAQGDCARLQSDLARYDLKLEDDHLGGGWYYPRNLLWHVWRDYSDTEWGQRAFLVLLNHGWDTSATCEKGENQTRDVIRQGETFLEHHSSSPYKAQVILMVGQAYETWWSLSRVRTGVDLAGYVDAKEYQEGAENARLKAIDYYERLEQAAPGTKFGEYARDRKAFLRQKQWTLEDGWAKFFCVYD
jgi:hypothetical protein